MKNCLRRATRGSALAIIIQTLLILSIRASANAANETAIDCNNSGSLIVEIEKGLFRVQRQCSWIANNPDFCASRDVATDKLVGMVCAKECPQIADCDKSKHISPQADLASVEVATAIFDTYPPGPYITVESASETITLPEPPTPSLAGPRENCPHDQEGLLDWHNESTWGGTLPLPGEDVTLPSGTKILISQSVVGTLGLIQVPSDSELIVGENVSGISIDATGFRVEGSLTVGSELCRIETPVTITLHGARPVGGAVAPPSYKGISVEGGTLNLHGKRYFHTWTRLAKTVDPGDTVVMLQHPVNWEIGQQIVLVTSAMKDSRDYNKNEVHTIAAIHPDPPLGVGAIVYLSEPAKFSHRAISNYQVEVGLLSRTIKVQGAADSEPTDPDPLDGRCRDDRALDPEKIYFRNTMPCMDKELTGFGGHIIVHSNGVGKVAGVELYRMGQTNLLGRYPMHFHLLSDCPSCYFTDSSVFRSFYRCVSIHGTHNTTVTENVAFDVTGYCYYLEDGVEQENTISFNLAAHIHTIGPDIPSASGQRTRLYVAGPNLTLPADTTASGFYITNVHNYIEGNAASGGWSGFAFPSLPTALQGFRGLVFRPSNVVGLTLDGNTAHSTGWWWSHAGTFYFGGALYYNAEGRLEYNPGRSFDFGRDDRRPCKINNCAPPYNNCVHGCPEHERSWLRMTNTKAFLTAGVGLNSWSGPMEISGFESHDARLAMESLSSGFWIDKLLAVCRSGEPLEMPFPRARSLQGDGFFWYDTGQAHIMTNSIFRNCGFRSMLLSQYDRSVDRGCGLERQHGCNYGSTVFGFLTHSHQFTPEVMQGTRNITFDNCGRRFKFSRNRLNSVSGRGQNWLDVDGSVSGLGVSTLIGSGLRPVRYWWGVEDEVVHDIQAPLVFIEKDNGPERSIAHFRLAWDSSLHSQVGVTVCRSASSSQCPAEGYIRHLGHKFSPLRSPFSGSHGLPVTANPDVVGPTGGFGWLLNFNKPAPRSLTIFQLEIDPTTTLMLSIPYPVGSSFSITMQAEGCWTSAPYRCEETFTEVGSVEEVRSGLGNTYYVDPDGILTLRVVQVSRSFVGNPHWFIPSYDSPGRAEGSMALPRFERDGVLLPGSSGRLKIQVTCPSDTPSSPTDGYCTEPVKEDYDPDVCEEGFTQVSYDKCCNVSNSTECAFADGSRNF